MKQLTHHMKTVGVADMPILPASKKRVGIILCGPPANRYTVSFDGPAVLGVGITMHAGNPPFAMSVHDFG